MLLLMLRCSIHTDATAKAKVQHTYQHWDRASTSHEEQEPLHLDPETCYVSMVTLCHSCQDQGLASERKAASCVSLKSQQDLNFMFTWSFSLLVWHRHALDDQTDNWFLMASQSRWLQTSQATSETVSRATMCKFLEGRGEMQAFLNA